ncbi:MAG: hypothetical protein U0R23_10630 [Candidatus Nanopelagicales bacterium]
MRNVHFDAEGVTVEIDGVHHTRPEVWIADHERQNDLVIGGDRVFLRACATNGRSSCSSCAGR